MYFSFQGINHHEKLILYYRNEFVHIGQRRCENRLVLIYSDSHIQKKELELTDVIHFQEFKIRKNVC